MSKADQEMAIVDAFMADAIIWHEIGRAEPRRGKDELRATMTEGASDVTIKYAVRGSENCDSQKGDGRDRRMVAV